MTARRCFAAKIAAGKVSARAGQQLLDMLAAHERDATAKLGDSVSSLRLAAAKASEEAIQEAARKTSNVYRTIRAQSDVLRGVKYVEDELKRLKAAGQAPLGLKGETRTGVYSAVSAFLDSDPRELANWNNVTKLTKDLIGRAHADFREAIGRLRSSALGFKDQRPLEIDVLRAAHGRGDVPAAAVADARSWDQVQGKMADQYIEAGGALSKREGYVPNPAISEPKARALGEVSFKALMRRVVDRDKVIDFATKARMSDEKFEALLDNAWRSIDGKPELRYGEEQAVSAAFRGRGALADAREAPRLFQMRDAEAWMHFADTVGVHSSPYLAMVEHIERMAKDTALLRIMGPNPAATLRFMLDVLDREPGRMAVRAEDLSAQTGKSRGVAEATRINQQTMSRNAVEQKSLSSLFAEVAGTNRVPVSSEIARRASDARALLVAAQLGSAMISSLNDTGTILMTARFNGLRIMPIVREAARAVFGKGSEVHAAQMGLIMDTLAHTARSADQVMGDTVRSGIAAKLGGAVIRASGLRKWTEGIKHGFALGVQAQVAAERGVAFAALEPKFKASLERYGIGEAEWKVIGQAKPTEPRPNALFMTPMDVAALGGKAAQATSEKLATYINSALDHAVLEPTPRLRAMIVGDTRPGSISGELRRSLGMYRFFSGGMIYLHGAQAIARGWDGSRMGHAAISFAVVTLLGAMSMQAKEAIAGREPRELGLSKEGMNSWFNAILQGGGLGIFGDILQVDKTKFGNTWASTFAGPLANTVEDVFGQFLLGNVENLVQGKPTHFGGDAAYMLARYSPGSSLWYAKLAFQREVWDRLALMIDPRTPERFARIEQQAKQDRNQDYWWRPGHAMPGR